MATRGEARGKTSPARVKLVYLDYFVTRCTCPNHDSDIEWKVANPRGAIEVKSGGGLRVVASRGSLLRLAFISAFLYSLLAVPSVSFLRRSLWSTVCSAIFLHDQLS